MSSFYGYKKYLDFIINYLEATNNIINPPNRKLNVRVGRGEKYWCQQRSYVVFTIMMISDMYQNKYNEGGYFWM